MHMRKFILAAAAAGAALSLAACSENTEDTTGAAIDSAMADAEANLEAVGDDVGQAADETGAAIDRAGDDVDATATEAEADLQNESTREAAVD
jgi:hypothetical protein